jgi:hypothetical protein
MNNKINEVHVSQNNVYSVLCNYENVCTEGKFHELIELEKKNKNCNIVQKCRDVGFVRACEHG